MRKSAIYKALVGVVAIGTLAFGGTALATNGTGTAAAAPQAPAVVQPAATQPAADVPAPAPAVPETPAVTQADTDNVEFESASEADDATEVGAPETEESEAAEEPGDESLPGGGHQDPEGVDVNHEFEGVE